MLLGRQNRHSPVPPPPTQAVIRSFNEIGRGGPNGEPGELRLDLEGPIRSPWNKKAARRFRKHFQRSGLYPSWPDAGIEAAFLRHTETIRSHYRQQMGKLTQRDINERSDRVSKRRRVVTVRNDFFHFLMLDPIAPQLTNHRRAMCESHKDMARFKEYIDILDNGGGMSEDEPDWRSTSGKLPSDYCIVRPIWRSKAVTDWLRVIDHIYLASRFSTDGRVTRGKWMRNRKPSNKIDSAATPVKGLPINFYDEDWLESLGRKERNSLKMKEPVDLTHTKDVMR